MRRPLAIAGSDMPPKTDDKEDVLPPMAANTGKPATVKLTVFALYKNMANGSPKVIYGGDDARVGDDGTIEILTSGVPYHSADFNKRKRIPDGKGLLTLYGSRDALDELMHWRQVARAEGLNFAWAELEVEVGYMEPLAITRLMLKDPERNLQFVNFRRLNAQAQTEALEYIAEAYAKDNPSSKEQITKVVEVALHPEYFPHLFESNRLFKKISVMIIPVADHPSDAKRMRQLALVRPSAKVISIHQGASDARIVLPRWMKGAEVVA